MRNMLISFAMLMLLVPIAHADEPFYFLIPSSHNAKSNITINNLFEFYRGGTIRDLAKSLEKEGIADLNEINLKCDLSVGKDIWIGRFGQHCKSSIKKIAMHTTSKNYGYRYVTVHYDPCGDNAVRTNYKSIFIQFIFGV